MMGFLRWMLGFEKVVEKATDRHIRRAANYKGTAWRLLLGILLFVGLGVAFGAAAWAEDMTAGRAAIEGKHLLSDFGEWLKLGSGLIYLIIGFAAAAGVGYVVIRWGWKMVSQSWDEALLVLEKAKRRLEWEKASYEAQMQVAQWEAQQAQQKAWEAQRDSGVPGAAPHIIAQAPSAPIAVGPEPPAVTVAEVLIFVASIVARSSLILGIFAVGVTLALYM